MVKKRFIKGATTSITQSLFGSCIQSCYLTAEVSYLNLLFDTNFVLQQSSEIPPYVEGYKDVVDEVVSLSYLCTCLPVSGHLVHR